MASDCLREAVRIHLRPAYSSQCAHIVVGGMHLLACEHMDHLCLFSLNWRVQDPCMHALI